MHFKEGCMQLEGTCINDSRCLRARAAISLDPLSQRSLTLAAEALIIIVALLAGASLVAARPVHVVTASLVARHSATAL